MYASIHSVNPDAYPDSRGRTFTVDDTSWSAEPTTLHAGTPQAQTVLVVTGHDSRTNGSGHAAQFNAYTTQTLTLRLDARDLQRLFDQALAAGMVNPPPCPRATRAAALAQQIVGLLGNG